MQSIKNLPQQDFTKEMHYRIMQKINFNKFRLPLFFIIILASINLINSISHFITQAAEMQTWSVFVTMFNNFDLSLDYFRSLTITTLENSPVSLLPTFAINIILMYYLISIYKYFKGSNYNLNSKKINL